MSTGAVTISIEAAVFKRETRRQPEREPDDVMARRLFPGDIRMQVKWLRAIRVVRKTKGGWLAEPVPIQKRPQ